MLNKEIESLDIISVVSFFIGLANLEENVDQSYVQDTVHSAVKEIHKHLEQQDYKIDLILSKINGGVQNER